ncbi:M24 family metallopeptidase [Faecalicatena sp. AGMB00832]|uniref:M24 family metallopeptidase n=1 Tax=Faecalicatena faecalis TaxID=2726362 RepID=A0ABS6D0Q5_9FIRM|nr:M24 family metallopeptidase [Faecalicatena faecalis]MBU3875165.1 M24 family metallopeptidase [Faecalicatena faecalis]
MTRKEECNAKVQKIQKMLTENDLDGVVIKRQANFSWLAAGGRGFIGLAGENACGMLLVTKDDIYLAANNIETPRLIAEEIPEETVRLLPTKWWHDGQIVQNLERQFGVLTDDFVMEDWFKKARTHFMPDEVRRFRKLGIMSARALEKACKKVRRGMSEMEIAGLISAELWSVGIEPITLLIAADDRSSYVRHYVPTKKKAEKGFIASICARKGGLVVSATRLVGFEAGFAGDYKKLLEVERVAFEATKAGHTLGMVFSSICDAYSSIGYEGEWKNHHQGGMTGYAAREYRADSTTKLVIEEAQAYAWNPSIPGAKCEDTVLTAPGGKIEILTSCSEDWPTIEIGGLIRPDVLYVQ